MKIKKPKRIMSLFLAALMCVTSLVGIGTTAYAAEETDDVYLISFPVMATRITTQNGDTAALLL